MKKLTNKLRFDRFAKAKARKECGDISMFSEKVRELAKDFLEMKNKESENE